MFGELISFVDVLRSAVTDLGKRQRDSERDGIVTKMLETYYYLKDAVDDGEALVADAAPDPLKRIASLGPDEAKLKLAQWDKALYRQGFRLYRVSENIFGQAFIDIVDPRLKDALHDVIGSKFNRVTSLHGIGAALFFRDMLGLPASEAEQARYVSVMAGMKGTLLEMDRIEGEIVRLREALEGYRSAISQLASGEEIVRLAAAARAKTSFAQD